MSRGAPKGHPPYRPRVITAQIPFRLTPEMKARIEVAAERDGIAVNDWIRRACEAALEPTPSPPGTPAGR